MSLHSTRGSVAHEFVICPKHSGTRIIARDSNSNLFIMTQERNDNALGGKDGTRTWKWVMIRDDVKLA